MCAFHQTEIRNAAPPGINQFAANNLETGFGISRVRVMLEVFFAGLRTDEV